MGEITKATAAYEILYNFVLNILSYDLYDIFQKLKRKHGKIDIIPNSSERYISFTDVWCRCKLVADDDSEGFFVYWHALVHFHDRKR